MSSTIKVLAAWCILFTLFLLFSIPQSPPAMSASAKMIIGLGVIWVLFFGTISYLYKNQVRSALNKVRMGWKTKFVVFAICLSLLEELITITLTHLAPIFGSTMSEAHLTVTSNYFDLVMFHSVIVLVPMFIAWAFLLGKYSFSPLQVFVLFGMSGIVAELTINPTVFTLLAGGFWIMVYGLMIYLPSYTAQYPGSIKPRFRHYVFAVVLPLLCALPVALIISAFHAVPGFH